VTQGICIASEIEGDSQSERDMRRVFDWLVKYHDGEFEGDEKIQRAVMTLIPTLWVVVTAYAKQHDRELLEMVAKS